MSKQITRSSWEFAMQRRNATRVKAIALQKNNAKLFALASTTAFFAMLAFLVF